MESLPRHAVIVTIFREPADRILRAVASVRKHEPSFPIIVTTDGVDRSDIASQAQGLGFRFVHGEHLKTLSRNAEWWQRFFTEGLKEDTEHLLKLDPDALFWRPFKSAPPGDHYGSLQWWGKTSGIQGGCEGFSRGAAVRILESGLCADPSLGNPSTWCPNRSSARWMRRTDYMSTDWTIAHICRRLGVASRAWTEIRSNWRQPVANKGLKYAVTHPLKHEKAVKEVR